MTPRENLKLAAETLRRGLISGYVSTQEVVAWADEIILKFENPAPEVIDVSLSGDEPRDQLASKLLNFPGSVDKSELACAVLRHLFSVVRRDPSMGKKVAHEIYQMYLEDLMPNCEPATKYQMVWLDDAFELAANGQFGTLEAAQRELLNFLSQWGPNDE